MLAMVRDLTSRKAWYKVEHVSISALNDATSASDDSIACLISVGRPGREFGGGWGAEVDLKNTRVRRK